MAGPERPVEMRRCPRCGHPTRADRMVKGYGKECAAQLGLTGRSVDVGHEGPDLLDLLHSPGDEATAAGAEPADECDGADRPADAPATSDNVF
ncbi:hypothetical protein [Actinoplanes sp. URMC 104]|uniref:hypothetical protein n=1 Tax=Actinoplanes sp. URMC 104 TaxID=3423409 RepID=UPI003F19422D